MQSLASVITDGDAATIWEAPSLGAPKPMAVADLEEIERVARTEGFAAGQKEGFAQGQSDVRKLIARLEGVLDAFMRPLAGLDDEVEHALARLATEIAGSLVRETYRAEPDKLAALVREAIASAGNVQRSVEVRLHPDDLLMLRPLLADLSSLTPDISLARGDVRVHAENVRIDATLASRLHHILENLRP